MSEKAEDQVFELQRLLNAQAQAFEAFFKGQTKLNDNTIKLQAVMLENTKGLHALYGQLNERVEKLERGFE